MSPHYPAKLGSLVLGGLEAPALKDSILPDFCSPTVYVVWLQLLVCTFRFPSCFSEFSLSGLSQCSFGVRGLLYLPSGVGKQWWSVNSSGQSDCHCGHQMVPMEIHPRTQYPASQPVPINVTSCLSLLAQHSLGI